MCEFCSPQSSECGVCERMRWEDDGGRAIDHDADTVPAETLPEVAALTRADLRPVRAEWHERTVVALAAMACCLVWAGVLVWFFGFTYRR